MPVVYYDPAFFEHDTGHWHPETAERLKTVVCACEAIPGLEIIAECPDATSENIQLIHASQYYELIRSLPRDKMTMLDPDTVFGPGSFTAAARAVGAVIEAVKYVNTAPARQAFCAVRPPGHHALADRAMGFCIFNNIAIGAAYAIASGAVEKVAIIDWDLHHGNGTQDAFYANPDVLYISLHQFPYYPGTGSAAETGVGEGAGCTLNLPMPPGAGDSEYRQAFETRVLPAIAKFGPGLMMISAGFDAHGSDPLSAIKLTSEFYGEMTVMLLESAQKYCQGRIISVLEGGYNPRALAESVSYHLEALRGED